MTKLRSKFQKLHSMMVNKSNVKQVKWCIVDTENKFVVDGVTFEIDASVEQYAVENKPVYAGSNWNDWTNDAQMDKILVITLYDGDYFEFYDENIEEIDPHKIYRILSEGKKGNE